MSTLYSTACTKVNIYIYISQYYFALQDLHKILPSSPCLSRFLAHRSFLHTETVAHRSFLQTGAFDTQKLSNREVFTCILYSETFLHREVFTHRNLYIHMEGFQHTGVCNTQKCLHTETLNTQKLLHRKVFTNRSFYTQKFLHTHTRFYTQKLWYTKKYMQKHLHTDAFTHRSFRTDRESSTQRSFYTEITAPERDLGAKANPEACLKRIF